MPNKISIILDNHSTLIKVLSVIAIVGGGITVLAGGFILTANFLPHTSIGMFGNFYGGLAPIAVGIMLSAVATAILILMLKRKKSTSQISDRRETSTAIGSQPLPPSNPTTIREGGTPVIPESDKTPPLQTIATTSTQESEREDEEKVVETDKTPPLFRPNYQNHVVTVINTTLEDRTPPLSQSQQTPYIPPTPTFADLPHDLSNEKTPNGRELGLDSMEMSFEYAEESQENTLKPISTLFIGNYSVGKSLDSSALMEASMDYSDEEKESDEKFLLPSWVYSENGMIGSGHLIHYLETHEPKNKDEIIIESFNQRKFNSLGLPHDTAVFGDQFQSAPRGNQWGPQTKGEYAVSVSPRAADSAFFMSHIIEVVPCKRYETLEKDGYQLYVGKYSDKRSIIQQPGVTACVFTSAAMILIDKGVDFDITELYSTSFASDASLEVLVNKYVYKTQKIDDAKVEEELRKQPLLADVSNKDIGNHTIVVDEINGDIVTMRDPHHGWRVKVNKQELGAHNFRALVSSKS